MYYSEKPAIKGIDSSNWALAFLNPDLFSFL